MKESRFSYEELQKYFMDWDGDGIEKVKKHFDINDDFEISNKKYRTYGNSARDGAIQKYIMDYPLEEVKEAIYYSMKIENLAYEKYYQLNKEHPEKELDNMDYTDYLRVVSIAYLLGVDDKEVINKYDDFIHLVENGDLLIDTILNAMNGRDISSNVMSTCQYPMLIEILKEENKEKAEEMMINFMIKHWWKNSGKYYWRDYDKPWMYVGAYAYSAAAVAKIKGLDLSKFENIKYFPIDMAYYGTDKNVEIKVNVETDYEMEIDGKIIKYKSKYSKEEELKEVNLEKIDLSKLVIENINFEGSNLQGANFSNSKIVNCNFEGANLYGAKFEISELVSNKFKDAELENVSFHMSQINNNDFEGASLRESGMTLSQINENNFVKANLYYLDITNSRFENNDLRNAYFGYIKRDDSKRIVRIKNNNLKGATTEELELFENEKELNEF